MGRIVKQVAEAVGLPSRTVRYYDRIGLVSPAERSEAGYRLYGAEDEGKLRFVRQAKGWASATRRSVSSSPRPTTAAPRSCPS